MPGNGPQWVAQVQWLFPLLFLGIMLMAFIGTLKWLIWINAHLGDTSGSKKGKVVPD